MLLMLLLLPGRMVAQTTTDPRCALFNNLDGITDVTITDNSDYPWQMLDLNAEGMTNLGFEIPKGSKGLMSSNYNKNYRTSMAVVKFRAEKPMLLTFKCLVSSKKSDKATITLDNKEPWTISEKKQIEIKALLSVGKHSLVLVYTKDPNGKAGADRAFIYDLKTATTISDYVAESDATNTTLTFKKITSDNLGSLNLSHIAIVNNERTVEDMCTYYNCITNIVFDESFRRYAPTSLRNFFKYCKALETISNLENLNTTKVTDMSYMFNGCQNLSSLDLSYFNTTNVTNMTHMFEDCKALTSLDLTNFNTEKVTDMACMFYNCQNLSSLDLSYYFNTTNVTNMACMFFNCQNLSSLDLSYFNTTNVTNMYTMFEGCKALTSLDLTNFNTAKVTNMACMFYGCSALTSLNLSKFDTQKVKDMRSMFYNCNSLTLLDVSNFNTQKVEKMHGMFYNCKSLITLDLSEFDTQNVTNMDMMFKECSALTTIYVSDKFVTDNVSNGSDMFFNCLKLKGFIEYSKNTDKTDHQNANYKTGYFTKLVGKNGDEKIGAVGEILTAESLALNDNKDFVAYEPFAAKAASYNRTMNAGTAWGTLCLPFAIAQSQETECKFYRLTGIDNDNECITLESYEGAEIPAGTPVLFKINEGVPELEISAQNADLVIKPVAGTNKEVNLVGSFTKIGGKDNQGLTDTDYIIGKDKFWLVSELKKDGNSKGVGIKPMRAYIHPATASQARAAMLSIGKGDGTTAIDNLNAISNDANAEYYDANGRRTNGLQKGLNIVKRGSKTYKIMVK